MRVFLKIYVTGTLKYVCFSNDSYTHTHTHTHAYMCFVSFKSDLNGIKTTSINQIYFWNSKKLYPSK